MPLPDQNTLEQGDVLAQQRNPGFETENLPSPSGFQAPDIPSIAPIPIPGTGATEGNNGQQSYLAKFNQSILSTKSGITPGNLPNFTASDVYNPRYRSILPGEDSEEAFAKGQPWYKKWGNALVKTAAIATGTFANGMMSIPNTISSIKGGSPYDSDLGNATDTWLKNIENTLPNYYTHWETEHPFMSALPGSGGFANFWADKFIKNLGYSIGAIGSAVVQDAAIGLITEGIGEIPLIGSQVGKASLWLNKLFTGTNKAEELLQLGRAAGRTGEQLFSLEKLAQAAQATKMTNGARYALNLYGAAASEAGMEGRDGYNTVRADLIKSYLNDKGYSPTGKDLDQIEKYARASGNVRFGVNLAILAVSDAIQLDAILKPFNAAKAGFRSSIQKDISERSSIGLVEGSIDEFQKLPKNLWGKIRPIVPGILTEGVFEEGGQFATQVATENFYERKYLYDKGLNKSNYKKDETPFDARDHVKSIVHSVVQGLGDEFGTDEGLENVVLGGLTGAAFSGGAALHDRFFAKGRDAAQTTAVLNLLNSQGVTGIMSNHYDTTASAHRISEDMKQAVESNNIYKYKNFQHEQFVNFILSGVKAGRFDVRLEQLKLLKDMNNDDFKKAFGLDKTTENVKTASEYVDALLQKADKIKKTYDLIDSSFTNPFRYNGRSNTPEGTIENNKHKIFESWKDQLTYLASIASDVDSRIGSMRQDIKQVNPILDHYHVSNFTDKRYLKNYSDELAKEVKTLQEFVDTKISGDSEADRRRIKLLNDRIADINAMTTDKNISDSKFSNHFRDLLQFHINGQNESGEQVIPQEAVPMLINYGIDINRLKKQREEAYKAFDRVSTPEGFERYFREANIAQEQYAKKTEERENKQTPPKPGSHPPGFDNGAPPPEGGTPVSPTPPPPSKVTAKSKAGESKDLIIGAKYYTPTTPGQTPVEVTVSGQDKDGNIIVKDAVGNESTLAPDLFFEKDKNAEDVKKQIDENTSVEDTPPPTSSIGGTKEGPQKKDLSFALVSTTDPVYSRQDVPFNNYHRRHQEFLFNMGSYDPDIFNQENKPKLRIIPITGKTAVALGFPADFIQEAPTQDNLFHKVAKYDTKTAPSISADDIDLKKSGLEEASITKVKLLETRGVNHEGAPVGTVLINILNEDGSYAQFPAEVYFKKSAGKTSDADNATIRAVYVIDDTVDPTKKKRLRDGIVKKVQKSKASDIIKAQFQADPEGAIMEWVHQASHATTTSETNSRIAEIEKRRKEELSGQGEVAIGITNYEGLDEDGKPASFQIRTHRNGTKSIWAKNTEGDWRAVNRGFSKELDDEVLLKGLLSNPKKTGEEEPESNIDEKINAKFDTEIANLQSTTLRNVEEMFGEDLVEKMMEYSLAGLFFTDFRGNKMGRVGESVNPDYAIFSTFATTDLTFQSAPGVSEERYTNKENLDPVEAANWWRQQRANILSTDSPEGAMQRTYQFAVSRGIPNVIHNGTRNSPVSVGLIRQGDLDRAIITIPTLGNTAILGAFNADDEGIVASKSGVNMPLGHTLLNTGGNLVYLNARQFTPSEANNIYEMLRIISDRNRTADSSPIFKYLHKVIYMANPEKGIAPTPSSITITKSGQLYLGTNPISIQLIPAAIEANKDQIIGFLEKTYHAVKNSELLKIQRDPKGNDLEFAELKAEDGKVEVVNRWKNYNYYLLSSTDPQGKARPDAPLATNIVVPQAGESPIIQKYSEVLSFDFDASKFKQPEKVTTSTSEPVNEAEVKNAKDAVAKVVADAKLVGGVTADDFRALKTMYESDANLTAEQKEMLIAATDLVIQRVEQRDKEQAVKKQEAKKEELATETKAEPIQYITDARLGDKKLGFRAISRDEQGNITDIHPEGTINEDGSITPYKDPAVIKEIILKALIASQIKQDDTNTDKTQDLKAKFKGRNFKRGTDQFRRAYFANNDYVRGNVDQEFKDVQDILPNWFTYKKLDQMLRTTEGGLAWGALEDSMIYVYKNAEVGTTYHEAFEAVWYHFVDGKEQQEIYDEFTSRKGEFTTYHGEKKNFSQATVKEAKEQLAEEFRDYKINGEIPKQIKQRNFFRRLLDFIKWLLGLETSSRNILFERMNKGYYRNYATSLRGPMENPEYSYYREPGLGQFSEAIVQDALQGMTAEMFGELFGENSAIMDQLEEDFDTTAKSIYDRLKDKLDFYFTDEVALEGTLMAETGADIEEASKEDDVDALIQQMSSVRDQWSNIKDNWNSFVKEHMRYLRIFGVEFTVDDEGNTEIVDENDPDNDNKNQNDYDRDIFTVDAKNSASTRIKLLIASIADSEWFRQSTAAAIDATKAVRSKRESSSLRLPKLVQYAKLFNYLLHNSAGINGIYDIWGKFTQMTEDPFTRKAIDANLRKFMNRLKFDSGFEGKTQADARLILSAENTLTKQKPAFFRQFTDYQRNTFFKTTVLNSKIEQVKGSWIAAIKGSNMVVPSAENRFLFSRSVIGTTDPIQFLNKIGININRSDVNRLRGANVSKFNEAVNSIKSVIEKAARDRVTIPIISSKQLDFDSRLDKLAELYVTYMVGDDTQSQHPNLDNQQTTNFIIPNYVGTVLNDANNSLDKEDFLNREDNGYFNDIFHKDSFLLNKRIFDKAGEKNKEIQIGVVEGRETWDKNNKSTSTLTPAERLLYEINNNLNGVFYTLLPADAKTEWAVNVGSYLSANDFFGDDSSRSNVVSTFANQMYEWLQTEIDLARDFENRKFIDNLNRKPKGSDRAVGKSLRFFKDILPKSLVDDINTRVIDGNEPLENVVSQSQMRALMREYAWERAQDTLKELVDWKVVHLNSKKGEESYVLYGFDKTFVDEHLGKGHSHTRVQLERMLAFREMNYIMNNIEMHKFFFGDPAQYKDELKRIKSFLSGREYAHVDTLGTAEGFNQWANAELNKAGKSMLALGDPGYQSHKNHFNTITAYDVTSASSMVDEIREYLGDEAANAYENGNEDDAGAYMTIQAYREMMWKSGGRWTAAQEKWFQWEMAWERNDKAKDGLYTYSSNALRKHDEELLETEPSTEVAVPILKLMHSGIQSKENVAIASLDKASWAPLVYRWYKGSSLGHMYNSMQKKGLDYIRMESAHKVGIQKESAFTMYDEKGEFNSTVLDTLNPEMIPIKQIGVQVEQAKKEKGQTEGSQLRKIAIGDIMENGVPIDFMVGEKNRDVAFRHWENIETEEEREKISPIYAKRNRHNKALADLTAVRTTLTMRKLGMEEDEDGSVTIPDKKHISDFVLAELERRELPRNIASAVQISPETRDFSNPLESNPQYTKIRAIIYSVLEKTITRPKVNGGQKTLLSVTGMEKGPRVVKKTVNGKAVYTADTLSFYKRGENGTEACEIMLPYWFGKALMEAGSGKTKEEVIKHLNSTEEGRKLLMGIGFRIPTQGLNSVDFFIVKDFLPEQMGDVVVFPAEITVKAGSDFDIDKMNMYLRNFYVNTKTGLPELLQYKGSEEATKDYIRELLREGVINNEQLESKLKDYIDDEEEDPTFAKVERRIAVNRILDRKESIEDLYYQKTLENEYFDSIQDLVSLPENYTKLLTPNDASELKGYRDKMLALKGQSSTPLGDYGKLLSSTFMMNERQAYMSSKQVVGISAVSQTAQAIAQNLEGGLVVTDTTYQARFPANKVNGMISLSSLKIHGTDSLISNINSQTTDGGVDVAKDKFLAEMGINKDTLSTFLTLVRMGAKPWWAITYLNQPAIQEFLKEKAISKSVSQINPNVKDLSDSKLLKQVETKFGHVHSNRDRKERKNLESTPDIYTIKSMEDMIEKYAKDPTSLTEQEKGLQVAMLYDFSHYDRTDGKYKGYSGLAWDLFHFYQGYNWDTATINDPNLKRLKDLKYEKANHLGISPASKVMDDTFIGQMRDSIIKLDAGLRSVINVQHGAAGSVLDDIMRDIFKMSGSQAVKQQLGLIAELSLVDYAIQTNAIVHGRTINSMIPALLLSNRPTAVYVSALKNDDDRKLSDNPILKALVPNIDRRPGFPSLIQLLERDYDTYTSNIMTDSFRELKNDGKVIKISDNEEDNKEVRDIYTRLAITSIILGGSRSGRGSFSHLIPSETYSELTRDALRNMRVDGFYDNLALYRGNWSNSTLVPNAIMELSQEEELEALQANETPQPYHHWFVNPRVNSELALAMNSPQGTTPMLITQPIQFKKARVIKIEELQRDPLTKQVVDRKIRLFRRVDTYGENGLTPLQYDRSRVLFAEINPWGDIGIREFYNGQTQSVLPQNAKVLEASDDQILYALIKAGVKTNAADYTRYSVLTDIDAEIENRNNDTDGEEDEFGNEPPVEPGPNDDLFFQNDNFEDFKNQLPKTCN
jgi:hypothetical protein